MYLLDVQFDKRLPAHPGRLPSFAAKNVKNVLDYNYTGDSNFKEVGWNYDIMSSCQIKQM